MRIALGTDHRGAEIIRALLPYLQGKGHEVVILGECGATSCDYPDSAFVVGRAVAEGRFDRGILVCGSGIGMTIAANKIDGVRAALVTDELTAELSRSHNDANILCLSGDLLGQPLVRRIVDVWLATAFEGGRHARRVAKIKAIEDGRDPAGVVNGSA
ncbi:MAG TPA: ribose 5-phosphate isomerase B [Phycisphaerales bacterium]|nr:ribose 5-phosphate isomerase B [Phycisphaerales bacterium]HMP37155.1 ribose 5-phosphate isomerase B [Phycisphaerales bacterium]